MRVFPSPAAAAAVSLLLLAACAGTGGDYPSLAQRPGERASGVFEPAAPASPTPPPAPGASELALAAQGRAAHHAFENLIAEARRLAAAARGSAPGSDRYAAAEVALAGLIAQRAETMVALAGLDRLQVDAASAGRDDRALAALQAEIEALVARQDAVLADIAASLAR